LGHLAESLALPLSQLILKDTTLDYFLAGLDANNSAIPVIDVLYSLFALEKFAQTGKLCNYLSNSLFHNKIQNMKIIHVCSIVVVVVVSTCSGLVT